MPMQPGPGGSFPGMMPQGPSFPASAYGGMPNPGSGGYPMPGMPAPPNPYGMPGQMPMGGQGYFPPQPAGYPMQSPPMMNPQAYGMSPPPVPPPAQPPASSADDEGRAGSWVPAGRTGRLGKSFAAGPEPAGNDPHAGNPGGPSVSVTGARPRANQQPGDEMSYPVAAIVITLIIFFFVFVLILAFVYQH